MMVISASAAALGGEGAMAAEATPLGWSDDPFFGKPVIDHDEWRTTSQRFRYVHGSFEGTGTRFALAFPEPAAFKGRFLQFLQGGLGGSEFIGVGRSSHLMAFSHGAYYVESNQGHVGNDMSGLRGDQSILEWRASAQAARFARTLAQAMYGRPADHGYLIGGSGGGMRSIDCIEHESDIWQGAVPFMINRDGLTAFDWSLAAWTSVTLQERLPAMAKATLENVDPMTVLRTDAERQALRSLLLAGYPRRAVDQLGPNPLWILGMQMMQGVDRKYVDTFWSTPGYEGKDGAPEVRALTIRADVEVNEVLSGEQIQAAFAGDPDAEITGAAMRAQFAGKAPAAVRIKGDVPMNRLLGAALHVTTGAAQGRQVLCTGLVGGALTATLDPKGFADVKPGDRLAIDNRALLAFLYLHRHAVDRRYVGMRQFFDGAKPRYAQLAVNFDALRVPKSNFRGKMILLQHLTDREALPTCAEPFIQGLHRNMGPKAEDSFRVWWMDNAQHGVPEDARTRYIDFRGADAQALADVIAWVEAGTAPPLSTRYRFDEMTEVVVSPHAAERGGIQPTIAFTANGAGMARAKVGEAVTLAAHIDAPPGTGKIVAVAFDFDSSGAFASPHEVAGAPQASYVAQTRHAFDKPGRHVVAVRAHSERQGRKDGFVVENLARVVVEVA